MPATRIVLCKLNLEHPYDSRTQHGKCRRILIHVLKPYDRRSQNQNVRAELNGKIFHYNCSMRLSHVTSTA